MVAKTVTLALKATTADAQAKLDDILEKTEELARANPEIRPKLEAAAASAGLAVLRKEIRDCQKQSDELAASLGTDGAAGAATGLGAAAAESGPQIGEMVSPMTALLAAGVLLSPVLVTVGTGLVGFGAAAAGVLSPVLKATQATGGLQANLSKLTPEQQKAGEGLLTLGKSFHDFEQQLAPTVLSDFDGALTIAQQGLTDLLPVSQATGSALGGLLSQLSAEGKSAQFQQFFAWLAANAGPDIRLVGTDLINLTETIPPLLEAIQPAAHDFLVATTALTKLGDAAATAAHAATGGAAAKFIEPLIGMAAGLNPLNAVTLPLLQKQIDKVGSSSKDAFPQTSALADSIRRLGEFTFGTTGDINGLTQAMSKSLSTQLAYSNSLIGMANDAAGLRSALKASHDEIGLHTAAQRASFGAANTYIGDLSEAAQQAIASGKGAQGAAHAIQSGLGVLDKATTKNHAYWQEVATLVGYLHQLQNIGTITVEERLINTGGGGSGLGPPHHFALGGTMPAAGLALVGEQGPELLALPAAARVFSHADTLSALTPRWADYGGTPAPVRSILGGSVSLGDVVAAVEQNTSAVLALCDITASAPGQTADGIASALGGVARGSAYRAMYQTGR